MSSNQPLTPAAKAALINSAFHLSISKYYALAATVMLLYDSILTFDREVEAVWKSKWSGVKILFFFNRYANIIAYIAALVAVNSTWPADVSNAFFDDDSSVLIYCTGLPPLRVFSRNLQSGATSGHRIWALFNRSRMILIIVGTTLVVQIVVTGWSLGVVTSVPLPRGFVGCIYAGKRGTGIRVQTAWFMQLAFITVVFGLMIWKAAKLHKAQIKAPLISIMTRDGLKYFGVIFGVNFINVMNFTLVKDPSLRSIHATFSALLTVIMINRLILSVREEAARPTFRSMTSTAPTSLMDTMVYNQSAATETATSSRIKSRKSMLPGPGPGPSDPDAYEMPLRNVKS
ncbi:hypothetical protein D9615_006261 [Tricholomella constricta]|uniref:DUF6533 domain-containing protein n=1 Tax=Tricholomella constricta TaxID=117010 RepID=A0A8H5HBN1_9AGAR|nr:hypothetical protein D9615_006261 [Tricholomella constricta]